MARGSSEKQELHKGSKVVAREALRDVPEGTPGKVILVAGLTWIRYWVRFDNGISLGTVDRKVLATPAEWKRFLAGDEEVAVSGATGAADDGAGAADEDDGGGKATPSGTFVPQKFLDRAAAARARLAA